MFMNPIKWWKERREQKRKDREAQATLRMWAWLEKIFASGMLSFDYKANRLFMTQPMASLLMAGGADGWVRAVDNIYQYAHKCSMSGSSLCAKRNWLRCGGR